MDIRDANSFVDYFEGVRGRTLRVAACIPREQIEWTPREGAFTFGDLLRHLAGTERYMFAENAQCRPSRYPGHDRELADGFDEVFAYVTTMHEESMAIVRALTTDDLKRKCQTPGGGAIAVWKWLRAMVEHEVHHRGQIYTMLGLLGVETPPIYGLTESQVRERSLPLAGDAPAVQ
jgi:uncharacterized damage-inducible protein DinB